MSELTYTWVSVRVGAMGVFEARQVAFNAFMEVLHEVVKGLVA